MNQIPCEASDLLVSQKVWKINGEEDKMQFSENEKLEVKIMEGDRDVGNKFSSMIIKVGD